MKRAIRVSLFISLLVLICVSRRPLVSASEMTSDVGIEFKAEHIKPAEPKVPPKILPQTSENLKSSTVISLVGAGLMIAAFFANKEKIKEEGRHGK